MKTWVEVRKDAPEALLKELQTLYGGEFFKAGYAKDLWKVNVNDVDEERSVQFLQGGLLEAKFERGEKVRVLGQEATVGKMKFSEVDGSWRIEFEVVDSIGNRAMVEQSQLTKL